MWTLVHINNFKYTPIQNTFNLSRLLTLDHQYGKKFSEIKTVEIMYIKEV